MDELADWCASLEPLSGALPSVLFSSSPACSLVRCSGQMRGDDAAPHQIRTASHPYIISLATSLPVLHMDSPSLYSTLPVNSSQKPISWSSSRRREKKGPKAPSPPRHQSTPNPKMHEASYRICVDTTDNSLLGSLVGKEEEDDKAPPPPRKASFAS
jgi:hypothetical protein